MLQVERDLDTRPIVLPQLPPGACGIVCQIQSDDDDVTRLKSMGVCLGRKVELVKGGDPLIVRVLGSRIGLSARLAQRVSVNPCDSPGCTPPPSNH
jgi:Fe2+ transport system protein FeoA